MLTFGFTSKLSAGLSLFLWEADKTELFPVLEDANFLSQAFNVDIYVSQSSQKNFHMISFDVLTFSEALQIQNASVFNGDYLPLNDIAQYGHKGNTLRLGSKGTKPKPQFLKVFYAKNNQHLLSFLHFRVYRALCNIPRLPESRRKKTAFFPVQWAIYETGIGTRKVRTDSPFDRF